MTITRRLLLASLFCTAALGGGTAHAATPADQGWYVGASAGRTSFSYPQGGGFDGDGYSVFGGYRFNRHLAIEGAYADLGSADFRFDCPAGLVCVPELYPIFLTESYRRADLALVGILPVNDRFDVFAKVGYSRARYEQAVDYALYPDDDYSDKSSETVYGLGGRLHFNGPWSLRLQWDRSEVSGVEVDGYWLGVEYRFAR